MKGLIQGFKPECRDDLSILTALARPGTLDAPMADTNATNYYIQVRTGKREVEYLHPDMEKFTSNGVMCFQEQIMAFLVEIAGYSLEEADQIRSAIAKKKHEVIMASFGRIREGCKTRGWNDAAIETVCQQIQAFSNYSFNKSHSSAYSELGYITMYLKHHHPLEWWTSVLNTTHDEDKLRHFVTIIGEKLSPPSLSNPSYEFSIVGDKIVAPLSAIKGIGPNSVHELVIKGPYKDFDDYLLRVTHTKVNSGHFGSLVKARAVDCFMDLSKPYIEARKELLDKYINIRRSKPFPKEVYTQDNLDLFLQERSANQVFNKSLLDSKEIIDVILQRWPGLTLTGKTAIPLQIAGVPILSSLRIAEGMISRGIEQEFGMVLLYGGSEFKTGVSKKNGRQWNMLKLQLSDGCQETEAVIWDKIAPLKFPIDSLVFVRGKLSTGFKIPVSITISEIRQIIEE